MDAANVPEGNYLAIGAPWVGQVLHWWPTPWRAVQEAGWRALTTPVVQELTDETPR